LVLMVRMALVNMGHGGQCCQAGKPYMMEATCITGLRVCMSAVALQNPAAHYEKVLIGRQACSVDERPPQVSTYSPFLPPPFFFLSFLPFPALPLAPFAACV
jgi:hypothetical protein